VRVRGTNVDGVVLINLLHRLYGIQLPHYHMQPSSKIHALDNVVMAFNMLEQVTSTSYPFLKPASTATTPLSPSLPPSLLCWRLQFADWIDRDGIGRRYRRRRQDDDGHDLDTRAGLWSEKAACCRYGSSSRRRFSFYASIAECTFIVLAGGAAASGANTGEQSPRPLNMQSFEQTANAALLNWCQERTKGYEGVNIQNFTERCVISCGVW
jgi:hypothetical protein